MTPILINGKPFYLQLDKLVPGESGEIGVTMHYWPADAGFVPRKEDDRWIPEPNILHVYGSAYDIYHGAGLGVLAAFAFDEARADV